MKRFIKLALATILVVGSVSCTPQKPATSEPATAATKAPDAASTSEAPKAEEKPVYPMEGNPKLTYWMELPQNNTAYAQNFGETEFAKQLQKATGVTIEYMHPPSGQAKNTFNLMIASNDLPDIIEYRWITDYPGGATAALTNKVILKLNDEFTKNAPNILNYLKENPEIDRQVKTDNGEYFVFPFIRGDDNLKATSGPVIRKDWLDELSINTPVTIADWEAMLTAFKEKKGATAPFTGQATNGEATPLFQVFTNAFAIRDKYFVDGTTVKYGNYEPAYKDFLTLMNKWYKDGLIDKNYGITDRKTLDANMLSGISGASYGAGGGSVGPWLNAGQEKDPKYDLVAVSYPRMNAEDEIEFGGSTYEFTQASAGMAAITGQCKNVEAATKLLDYAFSEEGHMLYNFGIEGVSYEMKDGIPTYTDEVMKNPGGMTVAQALSNYARSNASGPFVQDGRYILQYYEKPQQKAALEAWFSAGSQKTILPPISFTQEESSEVATLKADVDTYISEMTSKFIMGIEPIDNFDKYIAQLEKMNIKRIIELNQAALDRYYKR